MRIIVAILFLTFQQGFCQLNDTGVLVLAHGGSNEWNASVIDASKAIGEKYPTEVAFGMANPYSMQAGIDELESIGVNKIVVVQLFISSFSFIPRQNEYLLGERSEMAQPPILMMHGTGHSHGHKTDDRWANPSESFPQLSIDSEIILTDPLNDDPLVAQILLQNANKLSVDKLNEIVILVGHGPSSERDNSEWILKMESLARQMNENSKPAFKMIFSVTVRDDADAEIYNQAKENLRQLVRQSTADNRVIIVPLLLSRGGIEDGIVERLDGLDYTWDGTPLLPHPKISAFISQSVERALKDDAVTR